MSLRVRNEGLLALFAFLSKDSFAKSKMKMIDFSLFRKTAVFYSQKMEAKKNVTKHIDNHLFCSFCDYIIDCVFLKLRTKNEDDSKSGS